MEYLFIYLLDIAQKLLYLAGISVVSLVVIIPAYIASKSCAIDDYCDNKEVAQYWATKCEITLILCALVLITVFVLPTKQALLLIGGTYYGKKAVTQVVTSQKLEKVNTIIDLQLDKYIKELKGVAK
jgi:hypothetical protein